MRDYAYYNGTFTPYDATSVPLSDRSIFFGDAVYDVVLGHNGIPYQMNEHLARLIKNADAIGLDTERIKTEISEAVNFLIEESEADDFVLYIQLSAKQHRRCHSRNECGTNVLMTVTKTDIPNKLESTSAITLPDLRHAYCNLKTTDLLPAVLSVMDAENLGYDTAIFHKDSIVTEASASNVSIISEDTLITHPLDRNILPGISETNLIGTAEKLGIEHKRREFNIEEMLSADVILLTSTTKLVRVCTSVDGIDLPCGKYSLAEGFFKEMLSDLLFKTT